MKQHYQFDVALSFAIEDLDIATEISKELHRLEISNYLFSEEDLWGVNIKKETWEVYHEKSMFALLIISKNYLEKRWATEEREVVQTVTRPNNQPYILPLRLDYHGPVEGLSKNIAYKLWEGNAASIAITISRLVGKYKKKETHKEIGVLEQPKTTKASTGDTISITTGNVDSSTIIGKGNTTKDQK